MGTEIGTAATDPPPPFASVTPDGRPTRATIRATLAALAAQSSADDDVIVVLIGHGSSRAGANNSPGEALFNIPGPDLSAAEYAALLTALSGRVAFVNTASVSGPFIEALSAPRRIVISATDSAAEHFSTHFGAYFVDAFAGDGADADKDRRVSMLEAFDYARRQVRRFYDSERRLLTEHALLDDNGDGRGSREPSTVAESLLDAETDDAAAGTDASAGTDAADGGDSGDGAFARSLYLQAPVAAVTDNPERAALLQTRRELERELEALRAQASGGGVDDYAARLEALLVELALVARQLRQLDDGVGAGDKEDTQP
jgi:hypothetical protein